VGKNQQEVRSIWIAFAGAELADLVDRVTRQVFRATLWRRFAAPRGIVTIKRVRGQLENPFEGTWKIAFGYTRTPPAIEEGGR
jgi:hypothetical protein